MLVHHVDPDPLLLVAVDPEALGKVGEPLEIGVGNLLVAEVELPEGLAVFPVPGIDQLEKEEVGARLIDDAEDLLDDEVVVFRAHGAGALERLAEHLDDPLLLLVEGSGEVGAG